ncbi:hypothetical protein Hanom_Chr01g00069921 [Helianthus anomalus]
MSFSPLRFGQFCDFCPKVCFSTSGSKRFEILPPILRLLSKGLFSTSGSKRFEILPFPSIFLH